MDVQTPTRKRKDCPSNDDLSDISESNKFQKTDDNKATIELKRIEAVETFVLARPLAGLVIEYGRYFVHRHAQRTDSRSEGNDERTLYWPCCNSFAYDAVGCKMIEFPFIDNDEEFNDASKWLHPGEHNFDLGWSCCNQQGTDVKGCEFKRFFDPTEWQHWGEWYAVCEWWNCCGRPKDSYCKHKRGKKPTS